MKIGTWILWGGLWLACLPSAEARTAEDTPAQVVTDYLAAVADESWDDARACWSAAYLADAGALGITYLGVPCPWDLASPVIQDHLAGRALDHVIVAVDTESDPSTVTVAPAGDGERAWVYAVLREGDAWRLADRIWATGRKWPIRFTRYCRLQGEEVHRLDTRACEALDRFIETCARSLGADDALLADLAKAPIPYYVADDATVAVLTGHPTKGMANLAAGAVISSHFPHFHELVHLLVNRVLGDVPLRTHPLLQEGLACRLGGRWGRAGDVILYTGWFHLDLGIARVADVLTSDGFHLKGGGSDGSYAMAALVCDLVVDRAGWEGLMRLYARLSGPLEELRDLSDREVAGLIGATCSLPGDDPVAELEEAVGEHAARWHRCGIVPVVGDMPQEATRDIGNSRGHLAFAEIGGNWTFRLSPKEYPCSVLLSAPAEDIEPGAAWSSLYHEQWPGRAWDGTRWGLVCHAGSIGLYDYVTNQLTATWVADFSGEGHLATPAPTRIEFTVTPPVGFGEVPPGGLVPRLH